MTTLVMAVLGTCLASAPVRIAVMPLTNGEGVSSSAASTLTHLVVAEMRRAKGVTVVAQDEIQQVLSLDQQRQLLGCGDNDRCRVEVGNALGVDLMVLGSLARLGESWLLHLKLLDVRKVQVLKEVDRRQKGGSVDDLMDALPGMVATLAEAVHATSSAQVPVAASTTAPVPSRARPVNHVDVPLDRKLLPPKVLLATDGAGAFVAYEDGWGSDWPLLSSRDGKTFVASRVPGRGRDGQKFDLTFWEPRVPERWQASFFRNDDGLYLQCGEGKVAFKTLPEKDGTARLAQATVLMPRWKRYPHALVRDDLGTYWLVDGLRDAPGRTDLRLYQGKKGAMVPLQVDDVVQDPGEDVLLTPTGRLKVDYAAKKAAWVEGGTESALKWLDVESNARLIYTDLGPYRGEMLGTPCDGRL